MSLIIAKFVETIHIYARIYFTLLKNVLKQTWNSFNTKFGPRWKNGKLTYQLRQILAIFSNLMSLYLGSNSVKDVTVTQILKEVNFKRVWGNLESKTGFQRQQVTKYLRLTQVFTRNSALLEKFSLYFLRVFS